MPISKIPGKGTQNLFNNISDEGTEGTKVATGTTAQRGSTTGQWRYNTTTGFFEGRNATGNFSSLEPVPTTTSVDVSEVDSQAGGNVTIVVTGTNFSSGGTISFVGTSAEFNASTTTFNSATQITAVAPRASFLNAQEPYKVKFTSASGLSGTTATGVINVDTSPSWTTSAGTVATISDQATGNHVTLAATDADGDTITYSETGGSNITGAGLSLNSSTGVISGDPTDVGSDTTVSFTGRATAGGKSVDRSFNIIINPFREVQFALLGAGGGGGSQDNAYQTGSDENQGEGGCGSLITATYSIKLGQTLYYYVGSGGQGGQHASGGSQTTYGGDGGAGASGAGQGVAGGEGGNLTGIFMDNAISNTNALLIAGAGGGGAGRPATGGRDESNGGGGIVNSSGEGNDGTLGQNHISNNQTSDLPQGGNKNAGGAAQTYTTGETSPGTAGVNFTGGTGGYYNNAWGMGGGGGAGLYGGGGGSSSGGWGGNGGGAGSSFVRGLITDYTDTNLNNNFQHGITYSTGAFTIQSYGHTGDAISGNSSGSGRGYNGNTSYNMTNPASFSTYIGSLSLSDYGYGGNDGRNNSRGDTGKQGIIAWRIGNSGSWTQIYSTKDALTSFTIS